MNNHRVNVFTLQTEQTTNYTNYVVKRLPGPHS